jgi:hypothetical protein
MIKIFDAILALSILPPAERRRAMTGRRHLPNRRNPGASHGGDR